MQEELLADSQKAEMDSILQSRTSIHHSGISEALERRKEDVKHPIRTLLVDNAESLPVRLSWIHNFARLGVDDNGISMNGNGLSAFDPFAGLHFDLRRAGFAKLRALAARLRRGTNPVIIGLFHKKEAVNERYANPNGSPPLRCRSAGAKVQAMRQNSNVPMSTASLGQR